MLRRARSLFATLTVAAGLIVAAPASAHASYLWEFRDGFESSSAAWTSNGNGEGHAAVWTESIWARSGQRLGEITVLSGDTPFWSYGRSVTLPADRTSCFAKVYIKPDSFGEVRVLHVNVEVFRPSTWTYLAKRRVDLPDQPGNDGWTAASTPTWSSGPQTVYFRVSLLGADLGPYVGAILLDDVAIRCTVAGTIPVG